MLSGPSRRGGLQFLEKIGVWRSTFSLRSSCLCVWVPAVWLGRLRECAWKWLGPAMTLQFWWGRRLPSYSWNVRMHVFSFPVLVATSVSFPLSLHFLSSFMVAYCSATDRVLFAFARKENWLLRREGRRAGGGVGAKIREERNMNRGMRWGSALEVHPQGVCQAVWNRVDVNRSAKRGLCFRELSNNFKFGMTRLLTWLW